jgi:hypothetical protein
MQPLHLLWRGRVVCHHTDERRALSAFNAPCPIRWQKVSGSSIRRRACLVYWRTVRLCRATHYTHLPFYKKLPLTPRIRRSRVTRHKGIAPAANICGSKRYILYVSGPTCRGQYLCACPPSAIKGEACNVTYRLNLLDPTLDSQAHTSSQAIHHTVE